MATDLNRPELDDCWIKIFDYLPFYRRIYLESVCKRWQHLMPYSDIKLFDLSHAQLTLPESRINIQTFYMKNAPFNANIVQNYYFFHVFSMVLARCGPFLTEISLYNSRLHVRLTPELLNLLVQDASHVTIFNLDCCIMPLQCLTSLLSLQKLEKLSLAAAILVQPDQSTTIDNMAEIQTALNSFVQNHTTLTNLNLDGWNLAPDFDTNTLLVNLHLMGVPLTNQKLQNISEECPNLQSLYLSSCTGLTDFSPIGNLPKLENLCLNNTAVNDGHLTSICMGCTFLKRLRVDWCIQLHNYDSLQQLCHLELLWLGPFKNQSFTDAVLIQLAKSGKLLKLELTGTQITDIGLKGLADCCSQLLYLSVAATRITDAGLESIIKSCKQLKVLNCRSTAITDEVLGLIGSECHSLCRVNIHSCRNITSNGFKLFIGERHNSQLQHGKLRQLELFADNSQGQSSNETILDDFEDLNVMLHLSGPCLLGTQFSDFGGSV